MVITPERDFWSLGGAMKSDIKLSDEELKEAQDSFEKNWARND